MAQHGRYQDAARNIGRVVLFVGQECKDWTISQFVAAAQFAKSLGCDSIVAKRADGAIRWYDMPGQLHAERQAVNGVGVGYVPMLYSYGPTFQKPDHDQVAGEAALVAEMAHANAPGGVCIDMEAEWNGQVQLAADFASHLAWLSDLIYVSTWADPVQQNWQGVVRALAPAVDAWGPQSYNNWLAAVEPGQYAADAIPAVGIQPELDLTQEFGANNQIATARSAAAAGCLSLWLWERQAAERDPGLVQAIAAAFKGAHGEVPPTPAPGQPGKCHYVVVEGDTLSGLEARLHLSHGWFQDLYKPNQAAIETDARAHGHPDSGNGNLIFPGLVLEYAC